MGRAARTLPRGAGALDEDAFSARLRRAGLAPVGVAYTSFLLLPTPLDLALPAAAERLGARAERRGAAARRLATQVVYDLRKEPA